MLPARVPGRAVPLLLARPFVLAACCVACASLPAMRTFVGILVAFVVLVALLVVYFFSQGRAVRDYGLEAVRAAQQRNLSPSTPAGVNCAEVLGRQPPSDVQRCVVRVENGRLAATLTVEGGRVVRVAP